jgi:hypothetical protein
MRRKKRKKGEMRRKKRKKEEYLKKNKIFSSKNFKIFKKYV